jgi:hypothetical protein
MKMLFAAIAMMIASPALAQPASPAAHLDHAAHAAQAAPSGQGAHADHSSAPTADPHSGHDMSGGMMDCCKKGADGTMGCCAEMKAKGKAMACCDKMEGAQKSVPAPAASDPHAGHKIPAQ